MKSQKRLMLVNNYPRGGQFSIMSYSRFMEHVLSQSDFRDRWQSWSPRGPFGRLFNAFSSGRLTRDLDVYGAAPIELWLQRFQAMHIVDNSNAWYALVARPRRLIVTCHDMLPWLAAEGLMPGWKPSVLARAVLNLNMIALRRADVVLSVSETTRQVLISAGVEPDRIKVIPNTLLVEASVSEALPLNLQMDAKTFLHFGAGKFPKNTEVVLAAMEELERCGRLDISIILVGVSGGHLLKNKLNDRIQQIDGVSPGQLTHLYRRAAGVVMPSRYEGFGLPVIEAQSLDCPVIASDGGALAEVMEKCPTVLKNPVDPAELAQAMMRTIDDVAFREASIQAGRLNIQRYDRSEITRNYIDFYNECMRGWF